MAGLRIEANVLRFIVTIAFTEIYMQTENHIQSLKSMDCRSINQELSWLWYSKILLGFFSISLQHSC